MTHPHEDPECAVAHGDAVAHGYEPASPAARTLIAVFSSPVAEYLLRYGCDIGYRPVLLEPDPGRAAVGPPDVKVVTDFAEVADPDADVVVTDHHRPELGAILRDALAGQANWIGLMGSPRHPAPHIPALTALGVSAADIARVHRPIGLNIGSKAPAEIAISTVAGLLAERNDAPGGFDFSA